MFQDEDVYTFFEPELPSESSPASRATLSNSYRVSVPKFSASKSGSKASRLKKQRSMSTIEKRGREIDEGRGTSCRPTYHDRISLHEGSSVLDLKGDNYFSCAVARKRSSARYLLKTSNDVVGLLKELAEHSSSPSR